MFSRNPTILSHKPIKVVAVGTAALAIAGGAYGIISATASSGAPAASAATPPVPALRQGGGRSNARSGPAAGGSSGTVDSVTASSFTIATATGQKVTVKKVSSTTYRMGASALAATAITKGDTLLVLGITSGTTITASRVIVQPTGSGGGSTSKTTVVPFQHDAQSTSKQVGQIPANYTQGSGTIVSGTAANRATKVALTAYPGGIVDRVVKLRNGEYEVHNIGVNWPHHIFVNQYFKVVGAD